MGQTRKCLRLSGTSVLPPGADLAELNAQVGFVPILLQKSFWGDERKFLKPLMRFTRGDVRGPYHFIQNRSRTSVVELKSNAAAEKSKDQLSRDF
jgi:hypothetical protein